MSYDQFNSWWMMYSRLSRRSGNCCRWFVAHKHSVHVRAAKPRCEATCGSITWCLAGSFFTCKPKTLAPMPVSDQWNAELLRKSERGKHESGDKPLGGLQLSHEAWWYHSTSWLVSDPVFLLEIWSTSRLSCHRIISMQKQVPNTNIGNVLL